jgi:hypothetical protein
MKAIEGAMQQQSQAGNLLPGEREMEIRREKGEIQMAETGTKATAPKPQVFITFEVRLFGALAPAETEIDIPDVETRLLAAIATAVNGYVPGLMVGGVGSSSVAKIICVGTDDPIL